MASILYDTALGLQNLHQQQQCHRNIRSESIHIDIDEGISLLSDFKTLKDIKWKHAKGRRNTQVTPEREPFTDPLMLLGMDEDATWYTSDIYAFGITALQLTYGSTPTISTKNVLNGSYQISTDLYEKKVLALYCVKLLCSHSLTYCESTMIWNGYIAMYSDGYSLCIFP